MIARRVLAVLLLLLASGCRSDRDRVPDPGSRPVVFVTPRPQPPACGGAR